MQANLSVNCMSHQLTSSLSGLTRGLLLLPIGKVVRNGSVGNDSGESGDIHIEDRYTSNTRSNTTSLRGRHQP